MSDLLFYVGSAVSGYSLIVFIGYPLLARLWPHVYAAYLDDRGWGCFTRQRRFGTVPASFPERLRIKAAGRIGGAP